MKTTDKSNIEVLLANNPDVISPDVLADAVKEIAAEAHKTAVATAKVRVLVIEKNMAAAIGELRRIRNMEKAQLAKVRAMDAAKTFFLKTGDFDAYNAVYREIVSGY